MAAITANANITRLADNEIRKYALAAGVHVWRGSLVGMNPTTGYCGPFDATTYSTFIGIAEEEADNTNGAAGDTDNYHTDGTVTQKGMCNVRVRGSFVLTAAAVTLLDIGKPANAIDSSETVAVGASINLTTIGRIEQRLSSTTMIVALGKFEGIGRNGT